LQVLLWCKGTNIFEKDNTNTREAVLK